MTTPEKSESPSDSEWDEFLADRLSNYGQALRSGVRSAADLNTPSDCPSEVLDELRELENCLTTLKQACGLNRPAVIPLGDKPSTDETPTLLQGDDTAPTDAESSSGTPIPEFSDLRLGRFEIGRKLGEGTYGIVYLAFDPQLKRNVALKIPRLEAAIRGDLHERFLLEAESAASVTHPNIVTVFEAMSDGPVSLIVSEYIQGPSLATWLAERQGKPVLPSQSAELIAALADAVAHAHWKGILHRDIKPSNILLNPRNGEVSRVAELDQFSPKLTDFGLAKLLETQDPSVSGAIIGTPAYMPPEQIAGRNGEVGPAADVYALGMVLYELLSGKNPYIANSVAETIHNVTLGDLPKLSRFGGNIPRDLATICFKCLRQDKSERYSRAADLASDLRRFLAGRPILARNIPIHERAWKWCRRHPSVATSTGIAFLLLLSLLIVSSIFISIQSAAIEAHEYKEYAVNLSVASTLRQSGNVEMTDERLNRDIPVEGKKDRRTFPWWYLWQEINGSSQVLIDYPDGEAEAAISQDEKLLATGGEDLVIHLWSLPDRKQIGELKGHTVGTIECLRFFNGIDPEGKPRNWLLSTAGCGNAILWDVDDRRELLRLKHEDWLPVAIFLGDHAQFIATGDDHGSIRIWDSANGHLIREMSIPDAGIRALCALPQSDLLISSSVHPDSSIRFWNWKTGAPDPRIPGGAFHLPQSEWSGALDISPDGSMLAIGNTWSSVYILGLGQENFGKEIARHELESSVRSLCWRDDGPLVIANGSQVMISNDPYNQGCKWEKFLGHRQMIWSLTASSHPPTIYSCDESGEIRVFSAHVITGEVDIPRFQSSTAPPVWNGNHLSLKLQDGFYLLADGSKQVRYCAPVNDTLDQSWHTPTGDGQGIVIVQSKNGNDFLAAYPASSGSEIELAKEPRWIVDLGPDHQFRRGACFRNQLMAIGLQGECRILSMETGGVVKSLSHEGMARGIAFSPSGDRLYTTTSEGKVFIWETSDWSLVTEFKPHQKESICVAVSEDGEFFATQGKDSKALVYRAEDFKVVDTFNAPQNAYQIDLMDRGKTLVVMATDRNTQFFTVGGDTAPVEFKDANEERFTHTATNGKTLVTHDGWGHLHFYRSPK